MNSDVSDTYTFEFWFCCMHFLKLFLAFIQKLYILTIISFFQKLIKGGWNKSGGVGKIFQKLISGGGGRLFGTRARVHLSDTLMHFTN